MTILHLHKRDTSSEKQTEERLKEILKLPENKYCADCRDKDPRWSSWNLGIVICINCCGRHRGLGTHISKVKSIDLDKWQPSQVATLAKWGNYRANLYWEARIPKEKIPIVCIQPDFVRRKYENREYAISPSIPDPETLGNNPHLSKPSSQRILDDDVPINIPPPSQKQKPQNNFAVFPPSTFPRNLVTDSHQNFSSNSAKSSIPPSNDKTSLEKELPNVTTSNTINNDPLDIDPFSVFFETQLKTNNTKHLNGTPDRRSSCSENTMSNAHWTDFYDTRDLS